MKVKQLQAQNLALSQQNETQELTIKRLWLENSRLKRRGNFWQRKFEEAANRKPTQEEIREAIFGGQS